MTCLQSSAMALRVKQYASHPCLVVSTMVYVYDTGQWSDLQWHCVASSMLPPCKFAHVTLHCRSHRTCASAVKQGLEECNGRCTRQEHGHIDERQSPESAEEHIHCARLLQLLCGSAPIKQYSGQGCTGLQATAILCLQFGTCVNIQE
jgi:hypothetical protein